MMDIRKIKNFGVNTDVRRAVASQRSLHQQRVDAFMLGAGQDLPACPTKPSEKVACLRARLILEKALKTVSALGVQVHVQGCASLAMEELQEFSTLLVDPFHPGTAFVSVDGESLRLIRKEEEDIDHLDDHDSQDHPGCYEWVGKKNVYPNGPGNIPHVWDDEVPGAAMEGHLLKRSDGFTAGLSFESVEQANLVEVAGGCCDMSVISVGTLSACGLADELLIQTTDENNLFKFAFWNEDCGESFDTGSKLEGHFIDRGGKLIKSVNHLVPKLQEILDAQALT